MDNKKVVVSSLKPESIVEIKISAAFFSRLQSLYFDMVKQYDEESFKEIMIGILHRTKFKESEIDAYNLQTIVTLLYSLDNEFRKSNLVVEQEIEQKG